MLFSAGIALALLAGPASAQYQPQVQYPPPAQYQPTQYQQPVQYQQPPAQYQNLTPVQYQYPAAAQYGYNRPASPPPGSPPPCPALITPAPGSAGQIMYFCKPADASAPLSGSGSGSGSGVVQASDASSPPATAVASNPPTPAVNPMPAPIAPAVNPAPAAPAADPSPKWNAAGTSTISLPAGPSGPLPSVPPYAGSTPAPSPSPTPSPSTGAPYGSAPVSNTLPEGPMSPMTPGVTQPWAPPGHVAPMPIMPMGPVTPPPAPPPIASAPVSQQPPPIAPPSPPYSPAVPMGTQYGAPQPPTQQPGSRPLMVQPEPRVLSPEDSTVLPPRREIFGQMRDDKQLEKWVMEKVRISQNIPAGDTSLQFPDEEKIGNNLSYQAKTSQYPPRQALIEPTYLVHRRLLFEEPNAERAGWDLGFVQPLVSVAYFYKDFVLLPNKLASGFVEGFWDTNAGKCMPGSPTPYMLYPLGLTTSGTITEAAFIAGLAFVFP